MRNEQFIMLYPNRFGNYAQFADRRFESAHDVARHIEAIDDVVTPAKLIYAAVPAIEIDKNGRTILDGEGKAIPRG
jgi:hypothetical protein